MLHVVDEGVADRSDDQVLAAVLVLADDVAGIVDDEGVVARPAPELVGPFAAVEGVVPVESEQSVVPAQAFEQVAAAVAAQERVGEAVAGAADILKSLENENFDVIGESIGDVGCDGIAAAAVLSLDHHVTGIVDGIGVVARATFQGVRALPAIEPVIRIVADDGVVEGIAGHAGIRIGMILAVDQREILGFLEEVGIPDRIESVLGHGTHTPPKRRSSLSPESFSISYRDNFHMTSGLHFGHREFPKCRSDSRSHSLASF